MGSFRIDKPHITDANEAQDQLRIIEKELKIVGITVPVDTPIKP